MYFLHMQYNLCCRFNICGFASFVLSYILEKIVEHVIQTTKVVISPACKGPQTDSFGAIFVESDEEGKTRGVGNDSYSIKVAEHSF